MRTKSPESSGGVLCGQKVFAGVSNERVLTQEHPGLSGERPPETREGTQRRGGGRVTTQRQEMSPPDATQGRKPPPRESAEGARRVDTFASGNTHLIWEGENTEGVYQPVE